MATVVGVTFKKAGKVYHFDPDGLDLKTADKVVVKTARGLEFGEVVSPPSEIPEEELTTPLKKVLRRASEEDEHQLALNKEREKEAVEVCNAKIKKHNLDMKLINAEYVFDGSKLIFYFTAEGRVDFRELVKDLAGAFRTRIELRQIGVRDEAKMIGGLGPCGRRLCCTVFLGDFDPVSIRMAKEQDLPLNPLKISGVCGRLMCCLKYEYAAYQDFKKRAPKRGTVVETETGPGRLVDYNVPRELLIVEVEAGRRVEIPLASLGCGCKKGDGHSCADTAECGCKRAADSTDVARVEPVEVGKPSKLSQEGGVPVAEAPNGGRPRSNQPPRRSERPSGARPASAPAPKGGPEGASEANKARKNRRRSKRNNRGPAKSDQ